jgi:hypothetical protein
MILTPVSKGLIKQSYGASKEDALIKLQYDLYHIKHQSLWLDIIILLKTISSVILRTGIDPFTSPGLRRTPHFPDEPCTSKGAPSGKG